MRISIFVDGNNLFYLMKTLGWALDFKKLIAYYNTIGNVVDAHYYAAIEGPQNGFINALPNFGFALVCKQVKTTGYGDDAHRKGNMDVEIALDMLTTIDTYDMAVLVSGDGDFKYALELLRSRCKRFQVISHPTQFARELAQVAGMHYVNIASLEMLLKYLPSEEMRLAKIEEIIEDMGNIQEEYPI